MDADRDLDESPHELSSLRPHSGIRRFLAFQLLIWSVYGVVHYAASIPAIPVQDREAIGLAKGVRALTGLGISSLLVPLLEWRKNWRGLVPLSAAAAIAVGFAWMVVDRVVLIVVASVAQVPIPWNDFIHGVDLDYLFVMLAWTTGYVTSVLLDRSRIEREELLRQRVRMQDAQMSLLAAQLNPHFLFNSLNTIRSLAAEDVAKTREVVSRLSSFLRRVISFDTATPVRLEDEIDLARDYLAVEQARFEDNLEVTFDVDPAGDDVLVPPLILQPLIENAIKHGASDPNGVRHISLCTSMIAQRLEVRIENAGTIETWRRDGVGVRLTRNRLLHLYGDGASFSLTGDNGKVVAGLNIGPASRAAVS